MRKTLQFIFALVFVVLLTNSVSAQATYVGPEKCLSCHNNPALGDMTGWRTSMHANGYSAVLDSTNTMVVKKGVVADYDNNGVDDFIDGLDFNNISSVFDPYKPNAPVLAYSDASGYTITIGTVTNRVYLTYGGSGLYKQRYGVKINTSQGESKEIYISPIQYNEKTRQYVLYHADAWYDVSNLPIYTTTSLLTDAAGNNRSLTKGCAGCHVTGLSITKDANGEWSASGAGVDNEANYVGKENFFDIDGDGDLDQINTACERCHGPGSEHASSGDKTKIINPANLTSDQANNLCGMCHNRGKSKPNNTFGFPFDDQAMVGWHVGDKADSLYTNGAGYWGDGVNSKKHHQQFLDFYVSSKPTSQFHKVACFECHDVHNEVKHHIRTSVEEEDSLKAPITIAVENDNNTLCLSCHANHGDFADISTEMVADYSNNVNAIGAIVSLHTNHTYDPTGTGASRCSKCHMPKVSKSAVAYDVHSHTFEAIAPEKTKTYDMPNSCAVSCHSKASYPNLGVTLTDADFTDWAGTAQQALADTLMYYYGTNGTWWDTRTSVHLTDLETPNQYQLDQNYPNPFNPTTTIRFSIANAGNVKIVVYNTVGQVVKTLVDKDMTAGNYVKIFNASNLSSGVYFYRIETKNFVQSKKMMLLK